MRKSLSILFVGLSGLVLFACGGNGNGDPFSGTGGNGGVILTCATLEVPPPDCDNACTSDSQCDASFCQNSKCVANCTATEGCGEGSTCNTTRGRCVPNMGTGGTGGTGNTGGNACQSVTITPTRSIPNVMFLVDQSGSMAEELSGGPPEPGEPTRWEIARDAITQVVSEVDSIVRFGLTTYTSDNGFQYPSNPPETCPKLPTQVGFGLDNSSNISSTEEYPVQYPSGDGNDTPTGDSIDALVSVIQGDPPPAEGPTIIVLATDGLPDSCECPDSSHPGCSASPPPDDARDEAVDASARSHAAGIDLFFLWVGPLSNQSVENHVQEVANVGVGMAADGSEGDATFWVGDQPGNLEQAFRNIISASISCDIQMDKRFEDTDKACAEGDVRLTTALGTESLSCPGEWIPKQGVGGEPDVIELVGDACATFKAEASTFSATFPCGAIIVE